VIAIRYYEQGNLLTVLPSQRHFKHASSGYTEVCRLNWVKHGPAPKQPTSSSILVISLRVTHISIYTVDYQHGKSAGQHVMATQSLHIITITWPIHIINQ